MIIDMIDKFNSYSRICPANVRRQPVILTKEELNKIQEKYPDELKQEDITIHKNYDIFIIDCNYLIHYLIYNCTSDSELQSKINNFIKYLFEWVSIKKHMHLVFDGEYDKKIECHRN